jgi:hypothetical protein
MDQEMERSANHCDAEFRATIDDVEQQSGLDLFHGLGAAEQAAVESVQGTLTGRMGCVD